MSDFFPILPELSPGKSMSMETYLKLWAEILDLSQPGHVIDEEKEATSID